ncbi:hypothetical protein D9611_004510 [Ephemerocybe angulata]|uniref:Uncharacterized protein n=1 Tax=Ephemerocybe angulata TaxID=980116 RepID=A0A8H5BM96_9AGAR|nr:hypothetical protein D9611_004510 [Tulosesus angulatus]
MPGSEAACKETMYMVIQFLCARYPNHFQFDKNTCVFTNRILGTSDDIDTVHPLQFLLNNVPEDFLVTQKDLGTGEYFLRAAVCCSAIGFNMTGKMGRPLREIHGPVPDYEGKLKTSVDKFFDRMPVEKPIQRGSWSFEVGQPLYLQAKDPEYMEHKRENPNLRIEDVYLRIDWQTLRRLPQSKAILFNFKALFTPVTQLQEEPYIPQLILKVLKEGPASIKKYKGWSHLEHRLLPALEVYARDQVSRGLVPEGWQERTLDEQPFFPGWQSVSG